MQDKTSVKYWRDVGEDYKWFDYDVYKCKYKGLIYDCLVDEDSVLLFFGWCVNSKSFRYVKLEDLDDW